MKSFSLKTKLYLYATYLAGLAIIARQIIRADISNPWLIVALCVLASLSLILKVEGSTNRSHYSFNFLVYGFTFAILGTREAILIITVSNLVEWIWSRPPWFIQLFNTTCYVIVMQVTGAVYLFINPSGLPDTSSIVLGLFLSMLTFNLLNHLMVGIIVWLARGENFKQSGIFDFFPLTLDLALLVFGASLSFVWHNNPFALGLFLVPLYLIYSTLRVPALERKTEVDNKTGLFNHEYFMKQFNNELTRANRFDRPLSVVVADLDLLRNINNTYGHLAGDVVLIEIAKTLRGAVRDYDVVCRFGGEEFAVLLPETTLEQAFERAEIIRKAVENMEFTVPTSITPIWATMSLGIAHRENFSQSQEEIMHNADLALYHSKLSGRNKSFGYTGNGFVDFSTNVETPATLQTQDIALPAAVTQTQPTETVKALSAEKSSSELASHSENETITSNNKKTQTSKQAANYFISGLALLAIAAFTIVIYWTPTNTKLQAFDWPGLIAVCIMIILSEGFSIDLYVNKSSISTSAIPILVACLLFGTNGVVLASLVLATSLVIKYRSPFSRFIFNLSNHVLAGSLIAGVLLITSNTILTLPILYQIVICILAAVILYFVTTWMVAIGMSLNHGQSARQLWNEQFSWLAPYYFGIGLITYALIFGYRYDHLMGLLLMAIPMVLLRISQKQYVDRTREAVTELREKNQVLKKNSEEISEINEGLLATLSDIIDLRAPHVLGHSQQVSKYATQIAHMLGLNEKQVELTRKAGLLHDIGKLGIPEEILQKPGKLTPSEYAKVKEHAALGGDLVKNSPSLRSLASIIRHHHEFYDGQGYPDKLAGKQIAIEARIIAVADALEAMISDRPYRKALTIQQAIEELKRHSGTQFDPLVVEEAIKILETASMEQNEMKNLSERNIRVMPQLAMDMQTS